MTGGRPDPPFDRLGQLVSNVSVSRLSLANWAERQLPGLAMRTHGQNLLLGFDGISPRAHTRLAAKLPLIYKKSCISYLFEFFSSEAQSCITPVAALDPFDILWERATIWRACQSTN